MRLTIFGNATGSRACFLPSLGYYILPSRILLAYTTVGYLLFSSLLHCTGISLSTQSYIPLFSTKFARVRFFEMTIFGNLAGSCAQHSSVLPMFVVYFFESFSSLIRSHSHHDVSRRHLYGLTGSLSGDSEPFYIVLKYVLRFGIISFSLLFFLQ